MVVGNLLDLFLHVATYLRWAFVAVVYFDHFGEIIALPAGTLVLAQNIVIWIDEMDG